MSPGQSSDSVLALFDLSSGAGKDEKLPRVLSEVSGLAAAPDGRLFAHHDEGAVIYQVDPKSGEILKAFSAGLMGVRGDFEGLAIAGDRFFLVTSGGELLELREGEDGARMEYKVYPTGLASRCEMEGLAFDPLERALLLPCKTRRDPVLKDHVVVFEVPLETLRPAVLPRIFFPLKELKDWDVDDKFHPSAIEVHPETGSIVLAAAREEALLEFTARGRLLAAKELKRKDHPQPEGVTFLPDGTLLLADEGQGKRGTLTRYGLAKADGGGGS
jgi:uncharacterized protein YjiK